MAGLLGLVSPNVQRLGRSAIRPDGEKRGSASKPHKASAKSATKTAFARPYVPAPPCSPVARVACRCTSATPGVQVLLAAAFISSLIIPRRRRPAMNAPETLSRWNGAGSSRIPFWAYTDAQLYQQELERIFYG